MGIINTCCVQARGLSILQTWVHHICATMAAPSQQVSIKIKLKIQFFHLTSESEVAQSCLTLCDPMDCSLPGSSVHGIFQARVLKWVAISFSRDLPNPGIEPGSPALQVDALPSEPPGKPQNIVGAQ